MNRIIQKNIKGNSLIIIERQDKINHKWFQWAQIISNLILLVHNKFHSLNKINLTWKSKFKFKRIQLKEKWNQLLTSFLRKGNKLINYLISHLINISM